MPESQFIINGNRRSLRDLRKYIKGRKMTEEAFITLAEESISNDQLDERSVRAITPSLDLETAEESISLDGAQEQKDVKAVSNQSNSSDET